VLEELIGYDLGLMFVQLHAVASVRLFWDVGRGFQDVTRDELRLVPPRRL